MDKEQFIIGTAGHIDHGKTTLVKALTGVDADTLPDEKRRGITIELGFVFMDDPECDKQIMFIDVPGHEKLVRTMVAGASNIDAIMMVIAADEGVNLQTIEHFEIIKLLGISSGMIVLTKTDLIDADHLAKITQSVREFIADSFLADCTILPVSSKTGQGLDQLHQKLRSLSENKVVRRDNGIFRMPIDRVFTIKGFGSVVAGTVLSGNVKVDEKLELYPQGKIVSVRGVQVKHNKENISSIGSRTALNLRDIKKEELHRGQTLAEPKSLIVTSRLDVQLEVISTYGKALKNGTKVRLHIGTAEIMARAITLGQMSIAAGSEGLVQLVLEQPTAVLPRDRFVIRSFSPIEVIGGGVVLDASAIKHKRSDDSVTANLRESHQNLLQAIEQIILKSAFQRVDIKEILKTSGEDQLVVESIVEQLLEQATIVGGSQGYLHTTIFEEGINLITNKLQEFLDSNKYKMYMPLSQLRSSLSKVLTKKQFAFFLEIAEEQKLVVRNLNKITLEGYSRKWSSVEARGLEAILNTYLDSNYAPPLESDLSQVLNQPQKQFDNLISYLLDSQILIRLDAKVIYHMDTIEELKNLIINYISDNGEISVAELRDVLGVSRKYTLAILEYFDTIGVTKRIENIRVLK